MWQLVGRLRSAEEEDKELLRRIRHGQQALQVIRCRVAAVWLILALTTGILVELYSVRCQASHCLALHLEDDTLNARFLFLVIEQGVLEFCFTGRLLLLGLAPLADDTRLTRLVLIWDAYVFIHTRVMMFVYRQVIVSEDVFGTVVLVSYYLRGIAFVSVALWAIIQRSPHHMQALMWASIGIYASSNALDKVGRAVYEGIVYHRLSCCIGHILASLPAIYASMRPRFRQRLQGKLRTWLEGRVAVRGAVTIACFIGGCRPDTAVEQARQRFRCVSCEALDFEDMRSNTPDASRGVIASPSRLGCCDAFISHSWHDDAEAKWKALQAWRKEFVAKVGREPLIWFDKICVDQNNIDLDLRCLPIFLNGCERLVMLCGSTYLSRLWCITEVFAYVHMGCKVENIELVPVLRDSHEEEDLEDIYDAFQSFDVRACECFKQEDKDRIVMAIHTAFGCMDKFNGVVQTISRRVTRRSSIRSMESEHSDVESSLSVFDDGTSTESSESETDSD